MSKLLNFIKKFFDFFVALFLVVMGIAFLRIYFECFIEDNWLDALFSLIIIGGLGILAVTFGTRRFFLTLKSIFKKENKKEGVI